LTLRPEGRYTIDNACRIAEMNSRALGERRLSRRRSFIPIAMWRQ
jgi:hypothetical protein